MTWQAVGELTRSVAFVAIAVGLVFNALSIRDLVAAEKSLAELIVALSRNVREMHAKLDRREGP